MESQSDHSFARELSRAELLQMMGRLVPPRLLL